MPYLQIHTRWIRRQKNCKCQKFYKNKMLIRVFLHAEFISAMKTVPNPTIFVKNAKKKKND